jgi:Flp pilus assembly protein TadD
LRRYGDITVFSRRSFLRSAAALPAITCLPSIRPETLQPARPAPYLALAKYILPGNDEFAGEKQAFAIRTRLETAFRAKRLPLAPEARAQSPLPAAYRSLAPDLAEAVFDASRTDAASGWAEWIESLGRIRRVQFFVLPGDTIRYEIASERGGMLEYRVGHWKQRWNREALIEFSPLEEHLARAAGPWMRDVTLAVLGTLPAFRDQLARGVPYWRSRLDPASGIDIYGSNGIAVGDIDNDGRDEIYVCQPGGLPNRLLKIREDGTAEDITEAWRANVLDDTSCALFLDLRNSGRQDLVVLGSAGPVLFLNQGGTFRARPDAFRFAASPKGGFTGMAAADFDRDGKLDLYLCCYVYFLSEAQYTYAVPYHDARNGPPNFLFRNRLNSDGSGFFLDCTEETGMNQNNNRFSFAPAWCDYDGDGWPDLYVANDFGRKNLYKNSGGHFRDVAAEAGVDDIGPGMSAAWFDEDSDGRPDLYVANMWTDAGQRIVRDPNFAPAREAPAAYRGHTMGNSLFRNRGDGSFEDLTAQRHAAFGRWAWSSGGHDLNNDGVPELLITCGMLTNSSETDLNSFFWRQVVAKSPWNAVASPAYQNGWNALNQFIREEYSWNGREPNVVHARRGNRYFDFSGVSGFDFAADSRAFAVFDFDGDGCPDIVLKNRLGPQLRILQNNCAASRRSIAFRLQGTASNRDAIGARITVDGQTKWLEAGSGFLSQHSKTLLFGLGDASLARRVRILWPSGAEQQFTKLDSGHVYFIVEGSDKISRQPFRPHRPLPSAPTPGDNSLRLEDTWLMQPVPLPEPQRGPGLFVIDRPTPAYEIFRRYLFDWRTALVPPLPLLLNESGQVVKVYGQMPSKEQVASDLARLRQFEPRLALPFDGYYFRQPARDFFKFAVAFLWAGFPEKALPYLESTLADNPRNPRVLALAGQIYLDSGSLERAADYFRRAVALDPSSPEAANGLGLSLAKQGRLEQARLYLEHAISLRRDYADAINNLGVLYIHQGKINDAIAAFRYGIQVAPDEDILYLNLGRTYVQNGQMAQARAVMQELLDRKPDDETARHALDELGGR